MLLLLLLLLVNPFGSAGCTNFRTSTLQRHKDCKDFEDALHEEVMQDTFNNQQHHVIREQSCAIITAMKADYWLAKEDIVIVKYNSMLTFLDEVGINCVKDLQVGRNATYWSHQSAKSMQDAIILLQFSSQMLTNLSKLAHSFLF